MRYCERRTENKNIGIAGDIAVLGKQQIELITMLLLLLLTICELKGGGISFLKTRFLRNNTDLGDDFLFYFHFLYVFLFFAISFNHYIDR
jgi:hypothetical protein